MEKINAKSTNKKTYYIGSLCITLVYLLILFSGEVWPFGSNTIAKYDGFYQATQFLGFMFDMIEGNATIAYSNLLAGGSNIFGVWLYFFLNPFAWVALLFGRQNIFISINLIYLFYFLLIYNVFVYFLRKKFTNLKNYQQIIIAILYTFSGFTLANNTLIVWLNFLVLLPLLALSFERLIYKNKIFAFSLFTALLICSSYAVGSSMQIILIVVYFIYILTNIEKEKRKSASLNLIVGLFCGLLMSLIVLIPAIMQLTTSFRMTIGKSDSFSITKYHVPSSIMYYLFSSVPLIICILYFIKKKNKDKLDKFLLLAFLLNIALVFFEDICVLISLVKPIMYTTRLFSVGTFIEFCILARAFSYYNKLHAYDLNINNHNQSNPFAFVCYFLFFLLIISAATNAASKIEKELAIAFVYFSDLVIYLLVPASIIATLSYTCYLYKTNRICRKLFSVIVLIIMCLECFISFDLVFSSDRISTNESQAFYQLTSELNPNTRVKMTSTLGPNGSLISGVSGYTIFSSTSEGDTALLTSYLGYKNNLPSIQTENGTLFSDLLLGFEYLFTAENLDEVSYLTKVNSYNQYSLYKYNFTLPRAFCIENFNLELDSSKSYEHRLNDTALALGASTPLFTNNATILSIVENIDDDTTKYPNCKSYTVTIKPEENGIMYYNHTFENSDVYFMNNNKYSKCSGSSIIEYGEVIAGETYTFDMFLSNGTDPLKENINVNILNINTLEALCNTINQNSVEISYNKNGYSLNTSKIKYNNVIVLQSTPKGMNYSNGNAESIIYDLTYIKDINEDTINAKFSYPYTKHTIIFGFGGILLAILLILVFTKKRHWFNILEKPAHIAYITISCGILIYFYIIGGFLYVIKLLAIFL